MNRWEPLYRTITGLKVSGYHARVSFKNGDEAELATAGLEPPGHWAFHWESASVDPYGTFISVPASPQSVLIPWDTLRLLSDASFAQDVAAEAEKEAGRIGRRLSRLREHRKMTQMQVAAAAGLQPSNLSRIESNQIDVGSSTLWKILAVMGYDASALVPKKEPLTERVFRLCDRKSLWEVMHDCAVCGSFCMVRVNEKPGIEWMIEHSLRKYKGRVLTIKSSDKGTTTLENHGHFLCKKCKALVLTEADLDAGLNEKQLGHGIEAMGRVLAERGYRCQIVAFDPRGKDPIVEEIVPNNPKQPK